MWLDLPAQDFLFNLHNLSIINIYIVGRADSYLSVEHNVYVDQLGIN